MHPRFGLFLVVAMFASLFVVPPAVHGQNAAGPLAPHTGARIAWGFSNQFGPDAEGVAIFQSVDASQLSLSYASTRGLNVSRNVRAKDRRSSRTYVLGFARNMPLVIPNSTTLGISGASLLELRNTGRTQLNLITDAGMSSVSGELVLRDGKLRFPVLAQNKVIKVPAVRAQGTFGSGNRQVSGGSRGSTSTRRPCSPAPPR